jgi:hypothetical protein
MTRSRDQRRSPTGCERVCVCVCVCVCVRARACVAVCDLETSTMRRLGPSWAVALKEKILLDGAHKDKFKILLLILKNDTQNKS